jgi:alpha-tubulin suppressor-like RCC1 family protein
MSGKDKAVRRTAGRLLLAAMAALLVALAAIVPTAWAAESAPKVTKSPAAQTVEAGQSASFEATASGTPTPTVQWEVSSNAGSSYSAIEGATSTRYTIASTKFSENADKFRATFTNTLGKATTIAVALTVHQAPVITKQPLPVTIEEGQTATFEAAAEGTGPMTGTWEYSTDSGMTWTGAGSTANTLTITSVKTTYDGRLYRITYKNAYGKTSTEAVLLTVRKAPAVTKQPVSASAEAGQPATFEATASGYPTPAVQWEESTNSGGSWAAIEGATSTQYTIAAASVAESGDEFRATFKNAAGQIVSSAATLTVTEAPVVTQQPLSAAVAEGQNATFEAAAYGVPAPSVQWEVSSNHGTSWNVLPGATSDTLTLTAVTGSQNGYVYRAVFTSTAGRAVSETATLSVRSAPAITKDPTSVTALEGHNVSFVASASGSPKPKVQWEVSSDGGSTWSPIEGATFTELALSSVTAAQDETEYRATFTNESGQATTTPAKLTVQAPPAVTEQPESTTVEVGSEAGFTAAATGLPTPTVQWEVSSNGGGTWSAVSGATSPHLRIASAQSSESGDEYRAAFTNTVGTATTAGATLTVASNHYQAVAWGSNIERQLGNGTFAAYEDLPVGVVGLKFVEAVSAGGEHSLALLANGTVTAWGENEDGQLGDGTNTTRNEPVQVQGLTGVKAIAAGGSHSLALLSNGTVMAWGDNESGQLGNGTLTESNVPVAVKGLTGVKAIAAGANHSLALMSNGTVEAWGDNTMGELGNGSVKTSDVPVVVKGITGATAISAGGEFSLAVVAKGAVEAWGDNEAAQLGDPAVEEEPFSDVPVPVGSLTGVSAVAAGANHGLALMSGGTVMGWGGDIDGQVGNGAQQGRVPSPASVSGLSGVTAISAGGEDSVALLGSGSVMTWGIDKSGQLGNGVASGPSPTPVLVGGIAKVADVSAGGMHMLAFGEPMPAVSAVSPAAGPTTGGTSVTITGSSLEGASAVKFGSTAASSFTVNSATSITATAPAGSGTVDVTVTTPAGTSSKSAVDRYTYAKAPTVTALKPKTGPVPGGTTVVITGTELSGATSVTFGGESATFKITSSTSITATAPAAAGAGIVDVQVTTPGGSSTLSTKDHYTYAPAVESVAPSTGPAAGGTTVTVTGTGFAPGSTATVFKFGARKATAVSCASATTCTMTTPLGAAGTVDVVATVNKVNSAKVRPQDAYTYE